MIQIVDRLGKTYHAGDMVYAYFDTSTEKYIVLDHFKEPITPTVYGIYVQKYQSGDNLYTGTLRVEYATGIEYCEEGIVVNSDITVHNKLRLPYRMCGTGTRAIAVRMSTPK